MSSKNRDVSSFLKFSCQGFSDFCFDFLFCLWLSKTSPIVSPWQQEAILKRGDKKSNTERTQHLILYGAIISSPNSSFS